MVDGDDGQPWPVALDLDLDCGLVKGCVDVVDGDRVVGVCGVAADIAHDAQLPAILLQALHVDEWRDRLGQVDAVDKDVAVDDLLVRAVT